MKLWKVEIPKSSLLLIPETERIFFVQTASLLNDLAVLQKCLFFSADTETTNDIVRESQNSQALFFARIQSGKLSEGWQLLQNQFFGSKISKEYEKKLTDLGRCSLQKLKSYFAGDNLLSLIRNEFAFHYSRESSERIAEVIRAAPDSEVFHIFLSEGHGNCFYSISQTLVNFAILRSIDSTDHQKAMDQLLREVMTVTGWFLDFLGGCLLIMVKEYLGGQFLEVEIPEPPELDKVRLPYFVRGEPK